MAAIEFHGIILNKWDEPLVWIKDDVDSGEWQDPWYPSKKDGAGRIQPGHSGEWRSESDGVMTGTSGMARWAIKVDDVFSGQESHFEYVQVNWSVPFYGTPTASCGVFRSDPNDQFPVPAPPLLEIVPVAMDGDGNPRWTGQQNGDPVLLQFSEIAPYFVGVPWVFPLDVWFVNKPIYGFVLRRRNTPAKPSITFGAGGPSASAKAIAAFAYTTTYATQQGFLGAFPNFYYGTYGTDLVGGTILIKQSAGVWRDVPRRLLNNVDLENFEERMRATHTYAVNNGFVGGFPTCFISQTTFFHLKGRATHDTVCGTVLLNADAVEYRTIAVSDLGNPPLNDFEAIFRSVQDYANFYGFVGGFPTMFHYEVQQDIRIDLTKPKKITVFGVILFKPGSSEWRDILISRGPR